jgi:NAD(P)H-dependent FMN reductase
MPHIAILSASVRTGRASHRVALFFKQFVETHPGVTAEILDLQAYQFPLFEERLKYQPNPSAQLLNFAGSIKKADGVIIVTPEYNGGYPASLKNVTDVLYDEWHHKPVAISTASDGAFGGTQVLTSLQFTLWKMRAWTVPAMFPVPHVDQSFSEQGAMIESAGLEKRAANFLKELLWCIEAKRRMEV